MKFGELYRAGFVHLLIISTILNAALVSLWNHQLPFTLQHGFAVVLTITCWVLWWKRRSWLWPVLLVTLLAATIELAFFSSGLVSAHMSLEHRASRFRVELGVNAFYLLMLIQACYMRWDHLTQWLQGGPKSFGERHANEHEAKLQFFMRQFVTKSDAELQEMISGEREVVSEAREAADRLLKERMNELRDPQGS